MDVFIFSDESGVFEYVHNDLFVFAGLIFLDKEEKDLCTRLYSKAERDVRRSQNIPKNQEVKATSISNKNKGKLFRSLNNFYKFGVIIRQKEIHKEIYSNKKSKQRYLDYAYKIAIRRFFEKLIKNKTIIPDNIEHMRFYIDEHSTATNGLYELKEALEQEFKYGTFNFSWNTFYPPIFPNLKSLEVNFCNSSSKILVRASDIVANRLYYKATTERRVKSSDNFLISYLP